MDNTFIWLLVAAVSALIEIILSPGLFYFLSFSIGLFGAALGAYLGLGITNECMLFFGISVVSFLLLTWLVKRVSKDTLHKSNVYALQGKKGVVTETISSCKKGWIKIEGEIWSAASVDDSMIEKGEMVEVLGSAGSHLKVKKIKGHC